MYELWLSHPELTRSIMSELITVNNTIFHTNCTMSKLTVSMIENLHANADDNNKEQFEMI